MFASVRSNLSDPGFWVSVILVNLIVATGLVLIGAPGHRR